MGILFKQIFTQIKKRNPKHLLNTIVEIPNGVNQILITRTIANAKCN